MFFRLAQQNEEVTGVRNTYLQHGQPSHFSFLQNISAFLEKKVNHITKTHDIVPQIDIFQSINRSINQ